MGTSSELVIINKPLNITKFDVAISLYKRNAIKLISCMVNGEDQYELVVNTIQRLVIKSCSSWLNSTISTSLLICCIGDKCERD